MCKTVGRTGISMFMVISIICYYYYYLPDEVWFMAGLVQPFTIGEDIEFLHPGGKIDSKLRQSLESRVRISALYLQQMNVYIDRYENVCLPVVYEPVFYVWEARSTSKGESWGSGTNRHPLFATHQHVYYHIIKYINTYIKILHTMNMHIHTLYEHKGKIDIKGRVLRVGCIQTPFIRNRRTRISTCNVYYAI